MTCAPLRASLWTDPDAGPTPAGKPDRGERPAGGGNARRSRGRDREPRPPPSGVPRKRSALGRVAASGTPRPFGVTRPRPAPGKVMRQLPLPLLGGDGAASSPTGGKTGVSWDRDELTVAPLNTTAPPSLTPAPAPHRQRRQRPKGGALPWTPSRTALWPHARLSRGQEALEPDYGRAPAGNLDRRERRESAPPPLPTRIYICVKSSCLSLVGR